MPAPAFHLFISVPDLAAATAVTARVARAAAHAAAPLADLDAGRSAPPALLAKVQDTVLVRSFLIAVVLVAPVWVLVRKRVRSSQQREAKPAAGSESDDHPSAPAPLPRLEDLIAAIAAVAETARERGSATITVPTEVTVDGRRTDPAVVDALVRDSLRRSGLVAVAEVDSPAGRSLELRTASAPGSGDTRCQTHRTGDHR